MKVVRLVNGPLDNHSVEVKQNYLLVRDKTTGQKYLYEIGAEAYFRGEVREEKDVPSSTSV